MCDYSASAKILGDRGALGRDTKFLGWGDSLSLGGGARSGWWGGLGASGGTMGTPCNLSFVS